MKAIGSGKVVYTRKMPSVILNQLKSLRDIEKLICDSPHCDRVIQLGDLTVCYLQHYSHHLYFHHQCYEDLKNNGALEKPARSKPKKWFKLETYCSDCGKRFYTSNSKRKYCPNCEFKHGTIWILDLEKDEWILEERA